MFCYILGLVLQTIFLLFALLLLILLYHKIRLYFLERWCTCKVDLSGKVILITGGNAGLGFETAKILAKRGARIVIASRNVAKSQAAAAAIADATGNPKVDHMALDLGEFSSIKQFAEEFNRTYDRLDVLINNAGFAEKVRTFTKEGIDTTFQTNHVGPTYLTQLLLEKIIASKPSRIIFVASAAFHCCKFDPNDIYGKNEMHFWIRYATTKFCNILTAKAMSKILPDGVTVYSVHPGMAKTEIWDVGYLSWFKNILYIIMDNFWKTNEECAQTIVHCAMAPSLARVSGEYFDMLKAVKVSKVSDDVAEKFYKNTLRMIEDKVKKLK